MESLKAKRKEPDFIESWTSVSDTYEGLKYDAKEAEIPIEDAMRVESIALQHAIAVRLAGIVVELRELRKELRESRHQSERAP